MELSQVLIQSAETTRNSGVTVTRNTSQSWVSFDRDHFNVAFLQGHEADAFNDDCEQVYNDVQTLDMDIVELALAEPYLMLIEG